VLDPLPRTYVAGSAAVVDDEAALRALVSPDVVAGRHVLLAAGAGAQAQHGGGRGECRVSSFSNTRIEAACTADGPAHAVFVEQFAPGWRATVDGRPVEVMRANLLMRAVPLPPGSHTVVLEYHAPGARLGLGISAAAWVALVLLGLGSWLAARRGHRS
jgi:hypothetical protein